MKFVSKVGVLEDLVDIENIWIYRTQINVNGNFIFCNKNKIVKSRFGTTAGYRSLCMDEELEVYLLGGID